MYDMNEIGMASIGGERYMVTVVGWMVLENIIRLEIGVERRKQMTIGASE